MTDKHKCSRCGHSVTDHEMRGENRVLQLYCNVCKNFCYKIGEKNGK